MNASEMRFVKITYFIMVACVTAVSFRAMWLVKKACTDAKTEILKLEEQQRAELVAVKQERSLAIEVVPRLESKLNYVMQGQPVEDYVLGRLDDKKELVIRGTRMSRLELWQRSQPGFKKDGWSIYQLADKGIVSDDTGKEKKK